MAARGQPGSARRARSTGPSEDSPPGWPAYAQAAPVKPPFSIVITGNCYPATVVLGRDRVASRATGGVLTWLRSRLKEHRHHPTRVTWRDLGRVGQLDIGPCRHPFVGSVPCDLQSGSKEGFLLIHFLMPECWAHIGDDLVAPAGLCRIRSE